MRKTHQTLKRVTNDFEARWHFNTSIALMMELVNEIHAQEPLDEGVSPAILKRVLADYHADAFTHDAAHRRGDVGNAGESQNDIPRRKWPAYREDLTREEQIEVIIQINGRLRGKILVDEGLAEDETQRASAGRCTDRAR